MPNNEETKYTVDDIIKEFENNAVSETGEVYKATEFFEETPASEDTDTNEAEAVEASVETEEEVTEEITVDDTDTEDVDISEEIIEADRSEAENADIVFNEEKTIEDIVIDEMALWKNNVETEELTEAEAAKLVAEVQEEIPEEAAEPDTLEVTENEAEAEETVVEENNSEPEKNEEEPKTEEVSDVTEEDVNDKFLKKFLKGLLPWKGDGVGEIIRKIIFIAAVAVFIGAGVMLVSTLMQSEEAVEEKKENQSIITTTVATTIDSEGNVVTIAPTEEEIAEHNFNVAEHFKSINEDYIGYLEVDGCDIYEPIMQGDDNDYYLDHNYYGGTNKAGTVFLDYRCTISEEYTSPNIVFYGHNQEDGTMFGNLKEYKKNVEFYQENPLVKFSPEFETGEYVIYGYFITHVKPEQDSKGEVFHYHDYIETLKDEETFNWYINEVQERNQIVSPVDVQYGDQLMCLSTCSNEFSDSRFVVFARRLRDGESIDDFDFSEAYLNPYAKGVDWEAILSNETSMTEESTEITEEIAEETTTSVPETEETKKKKKTTTEDTRRKYKDVRDGKYTTKKTTQTETETETVSNDESVSDDSAAETTVPEGDEASTETAVPSDSSAGEEGTSPF
ncbi:MAG: class B sortase [Oscillospiraceae bacterium]|nr:class B sortase [Oscillospiraceae bacterium]